MKSLWYRSRSSLFTRTTADQTRIQNNRDPPFKKKINVVFLVTHLLISFQFLISSNDHIAAQDIAFFYIHFLGGIIWFIFNKSFCVVSVFSLRINWGRAAKSLLRSSHKDRIGQEFFRSFLYERFISDLPSRWRTRNRFLTSINNFSDDTGREVRVLGLKFGYTKIFFPNKKWTKNKNSTWIDFSQSFWSSWFFRTFVVIPYILYPW